MFSRFHFVEVPAVNTFQKIISKLLRLPVAEYDAGKRFQRERSYLPGTVQDPRFDANESTRSELVRKSRWFEKNDALANRLAEVFAEFTVGAYGPPMTPASSDDEWNQRATDWLRDWNSNADINTRLGYSGLMTTAAWRRFFDGEFFILKTLGDTNRPRLQGIASHRVATPGDKMDQEGISIVDGVKIDSRGRPEGYFIQEGFDSDQFTFRTTNEVIHIFEPESPGQYRGLPMLTPVLNDLHDFNDLFMFEMIAAKVQGKDAVFLETQTGEVPRGSFSIPSSGINIGGTNQTDASKALSERQALLNKVFPGRAIAGRLGEKMNYLASNRPSVTTQWFFDYYASRVCAGTGISKLLVFPWSIQGTVVRSELDLARNYFLSRFASFQSACQQIYWYVIGSARFIDSRLADAPSDWTKVIIRPPRAVNVDVGRNSAATIAELECGLTSYEEQFAMRGLDYKEQLRQRAREEQLLDKIAAEFNVPVDRIRKSITESLQNQIALEQSAQSADDFQNA